MYCKNCKKEVVEGSEFCPYCGNKLSSDSENLGPINYKVYDIGQTNIKPKKRTGKGLIIVIICCVILIASAIYIVISSNSSSKKSSSTDENIVQQEDFVIYELNEAGFYKTDYILEERFNQKGDLTYCKYKSADKIYEENYTYIYDSQGRVTQIILNNGYETTLNIDYIEDDIIKITTTYELAKYEYDFNYIEGQDIIEVVEYSTFNQTIGNVIQGQRQYDGKFIITTKTINGKQYSLITEINDNGQVERQKIYENSTDSDSSLTMLNIIPLQYIDLIVGNKSTNIITEYLGLSCISLPIINGGKDILDIDFENNSSEVRGKYFYDNQGRMLYGKNNNSQMYYKYEAVENNYYWAETIMEADEEDYQGLGMQGRYIKQRIKFYTNENNEIYRYELYNVEYLSEEEFTTLKEEYMEYINNNKIDSDSIIVEFTEQGNTNNQTEEQNEVTNSSNVNTIIDNNTNINTSENDYQQDTSDNNNNSYSETNNSEDIDDTLEITSMTLRNGINLAQAGNFTSRTENIALELEVDFYMGNDVKEEDKNFTATINGEDVSISENALDHMEPNIKFVKNDVTLKLGKNTFKVNVTNGKGVSESKTYTITFSPYKPKFYSTYTHGNILYIEVRNEEFTVLDSGFTVTVNGKSTEKEHTSPEVERFSYVMEDGETEFKIVAKDKYGQSITKNYEI